MSIKIILYLTYIFCVLVSYFVYRKFFVYKSGKIMLTTIPSGNIDDDEIQYLIKKGRRSFSIFTYGISIAALIFFLLGDIWVLNSFILLIYFYYIFTAFLLNSYMKKMRKLKSEKKLRTSTRKYIDVTISNDINKMRFGKKQWLIPLLVLILGSFIAGMVYGKVDGIIVSICFLVLISTIAMSFVIDRLPIKIISSDPDKNRYFNQKRVVSIQEKIFYFSCMYSVLLTFVVFVASKDEFSYIPFMGIIIPSIIFILYMVYLFKKMDDFEQQFVDEDDYFVDDDEYYDILGYNNSNDKRIFVSDPVFSGNLIINRANPKGRAILSLTYIIILAIPFILFSFGATEYKYTINTNNIVISAGLYKDEVEFSNIESMKILNELPDGRIIKTNGVSLDYQSYGTFNIRNVGKVRFYLYNDTNKLIEIKQKKGKNIYFNEKTLKETESLYKNLTRKYKIND